MPRANVRDMLEIAHNSRLGGHFVVAKTLARLEKLHWRSKSKDVRSYCSGCLKCQQVKDNRKKPLGSPEPLEIPTRRWGSVATDFITRLPQTSSQRVAIMTVVDRLTRRIRLVACRTMNTAEELAKLYFKHIFCLHGMPDSIVSDRGPRFTGKFWTELMRLCGLLLKMSTSRHPQTDGNSEAMNRMIQNYLRCYCNRWLDDWDEHLEAAEFAYNSSPTAETNLSPFEADLGYQPRSPFNLFLGSDSTVEALDDLKKVQESVLSEITLPTS